MKKYWYFKIRNIIEFYMHFVNNFSHPTCTNITRYFTDKHTYVYEDTRLGFKRIFKGERKCFITHTR